MERHQHLDGDYNVGEVRQGVLHSLVINTTVASAVTVYDSLVGSGTAIATFQASAGLGTYIYDVRFTVGLTIVTAGASNITVAYV